MENDENGRTDDDGHDDSDDGDDDSDDGLMIGKMPKLPGGWQGLCLLF